MKKSKFFMARILAIVLLFGMLFLGCATNHYSLVISNVHNARQVQIRDAGTTQWIAAGNLQEFDRSRFSERVDIRVVDSDGLVYTKYDVPFARNDFEVTSKESYIGMGSTFLGTGLLGIIVFIYFILGGGQ
ncbi:MAG: hypothetical protein FWD13_07530 [Treponema sp.]|nr:hypothetical protein [Treponema sp.]